MMFWKNILIVAATYALLSSAGFESFSFGEGTMVENGQQALEIAQEYVSEKYQQDFEDHDVAIILHDDIWIVAYMDFGPGRYTYGGGTPQLEIKKSNGEVISCELSK